MSNTQPVTFDSTRAKAKITIGGVTYEMPNIETLEAPSEERGTREIAAFQNSPRKIMKPSWITPGEMTVNMYFNPGHPALRAIQTIKDKTQTYPISIEHPQLEIAAVTDFRLAANGEVTFGDAKAGGNERKFDYAGYAIGIGHFWITGTGASVKNYPIKSFDAAGEYATVEALPAATIAAVTADTAAKLVLPKFEIKYSGFVTGDTKEFASDAEVMNELTFAVASEITTYMEGVAL